MSLMAWKFLQATRNPMTGMWSVMPFAGGLFDQPEWLIKDLTTIGEMDRTVRDELKPGGD